MTMALCTIASFSRSDLLAHLHVHKVAPDSKVRSSTVIESAQVMAASE